MDSLNWCYGGDRPWNKQYEITNAIRKASQAHLSSLQQFHQIASARSPRLIQTDLSNTLQSALQSPWQLWVMGWGRDYSGFYSAVSPAAKPVYRENKEGGNAAASGGLCSCREKYVTSIYAELEIIPSLSLYEHSTQQSYNVLWLLWENITRCLGVNETKMNALGRRLI